MKLEHEQIKGSFTVRPDDLPEGEGPFVTTTYIYREVAFDYSGFIWNIGLTSEGHIS